jgi:hypothetical protein
MTDFDPIKAMHEEIAGFAEAMRQMTAIARHKDAEADEAMTTRDALLKAVGLLKELIETRRARLRELEDEKTT